MTFDELSAYLRQFRPEEAPGLPEEIPGWQEAPYDVHPPFFRGAERKLYAMPVRRMAAQPQHEQPYYELLYTLEGSVTCTVDGDPICVPAGSLLLMAANIRHQILPCGVHDLAVSVFLDENVLNPRVFQTICQLPTVGGIFSPNLFSRWLLTELNEQADDYGRRMLCNCFDPNSHSEQAAELLLQLLLTEADGTPITSHDGDIEDELERIAQYIRAHCTDVSLEQTAQHFGYSPDYLSAAIRQRYGDSFTGYRNRYCLLRAAELLCSTNCSIADAARTAGIYSLSHFHKMFAELFHMPPTQYRKRYRITETRETAETDD